MKRSDSSARLRIVSATAKDVPVLLRFIQELAEYERLSDEVVATEETLRESLFGARSAAEALVAYWDDEPAGSAIFFHNFSSFLGRPGLYIEDIYVRSEMRGKGIGRAMLVRLARSARERCCGRMEWAVLDWNEPAIRFYRNLGAQPMDDWTVLRLTGEALNRLAADQ